MTANARTDPLERVALPEKPEVEDRRKSSDRRQAPRSRTLRAGCIQWGNGHAAKCIIRNLSESGAQLEVRDPVPKTFELIIGNQMSGSCCVVWRKESQIGVKFEGHLQLPRVSATVPSSCKQYAGLCRELAKRVRAPDRELLLGMARAWETIGRRYRSISRAAAAAEV
jgi:hypothetical protein